MNVNNENGPEDNQENAESTQQTAEQQRQGKLRDGIRQLAKEEFKQDDAGTFNAVQEDGFELSDELLKKYKEKTGEKDLTDDEKAEYAKEFVREIKMLGFPLDRDRQKVRRIIEQEYNFTDVENQKWKGKLQDISGRELKNLLKGRVKRQEFLELESVLDMSVRDKIEDLDEFSDYFDFDNITNDQKIILFTIQSGDRQVDVNDLQVLFNTEEGKDILPDIQAKRNFLRDYCPTLTVQDIFDLKIGISESNIKHYVDEEIKKYCDINNIETPQEGGKIPSYLIPEYDEITIDLGFFSDNEIEVILNDKGLVELAKSLNKLKEEAQDEKGKKIDTFKGLIEEIAKSELLQKLSLANKTKINNQGELKDVFQEGNVINIYNEIEGIPTRVLQKITKIDEDNIYLSSVGDKTGIFQKESAPRAVSFSKFREIINNKHNVLFTFYREVEFDTKKKEGGFGKTIYNGNYDFTSYTGRDYDHDAAKLDILNRVRLDLKSKNQNSDVDYDNIEESEILSALKNKAEYEDLYEDYKEVESDVKEYENFEQNTINRLLQTINNHDRDGEKFGFEPGVVMNIKGFNGTDEGMAQIKSFNYTEGKMTLISQNGEHEVTFADFFGKIEAKVFSVSRTAKLDTGNTYDLMLEGLAAQEDIGHHFSDMKIVNGQFAKTEEDANGQINRKTIEYFYGESNSGKYALRVLNISGDYATVQEGDFEETKSKDGKRLNKDDKGYDDAKRDGGVVYKLGSRKRKILVAELNDALHTYNMIPGKGDGETEDLPEGADRKLGFTGFWGKYFDCYSVMDMISGSKQFMDSISDKFKRGSDYKAARFAQKFDWVTVGDVGIEMNMQIEAKQREAMDDAMKRLKSIDSWMAANLILKWLKSRSASEEQKEAGMIFMLENYGLLYAKGDLHNYKGKFLWYEAMGGKIGDELYKAKKKECEEGNVAFTEELLLFDLMKAQCSGRIKPKRRSRLHKEFKGLWPKGRDEENKKGEEDGGDGASIDDRVTMGINEMAGGTYNNAIGVLKSVIGKGGPIEKVNAIPAVMLLSGVGYTMDSNRISDKFKNFSAMGMMIPLTFFTYQPWMMDLFLETVVELSKRMEKIYGGKFVGMYDRAREIADDAKNNQDSITEKKRVKKAADFWGDFGKPLIGALYGLNSQNDDYAKTDKILKLEEDKNPVFKRYNELMHGEITKNQIEYTKDQDIMTDCYNGENMVGTSGLNIYKATKQALLGDQAGGFGHSTLGGQMWKEIRAELNPNSPRGILNKMYDPTGDPIRNREIQKILYKENIRGIVGAILANHGSRGNVLEGLFKPSGQLYALKRDLGIKIVEDFGNIASTIPGEKGVNDGEVMGKTNKNVEALLDKIVNNIVDNGGSVGDNIADQTSREAYDILTFTGKKEDKNKNQQEEQDYGDDYYYGNVG